MSINNLSKSEIIDELQISEYYRDALHFGLIDIGRRLNIDTDNIKTDEELINIVSNKFNELINNIPNNIKEKLKIN